MEDNNTQPDSENTPQQPGEGQPGNKSAKPENKMVNWDALQKEWSDDLHNNPRYRSYFEKYKKSGIDFFIKEYVFRKMCWLQFGPRKKDEIEYRLTQFENEAYELMWEIQQKKLFNLQCEWRAEKIELPGVETSYDFKYWEHHIKTCPFIPPITGDEIELYRQYLLSSNYSKIQWLHEWQDYDLFKAEYVGDTGIISMPEWYMFYDSRKATGILLSYPDIRGAKEGRYMAAVRRRNIEQYEKEKKENPGKYPEPDTRPHLYTYPYIKSLDEFVRLFEDKKTYRLFRAYESEYAIENDNINSVFADLLCIDEKIPVQANADWRNALNDALHQYRRQKIAQALTAAYDEYLMRFNNNLGWDEDDGKPDTQAYLLDLSKKALIEGRVLLGEPGDLNF